MEGFYKIVQTLINISSIVFGLNLIILLLLGPFRKTRGVTAMALLYSSFLFGITTWLTGLFLTYMFWGIIGVIVGLFIVGIGVVPIGALACLFNASWQSLWTLVILVAVTFGARWIGWLLIATLEEKQEPKGVFDTTASWDEDTIEDTIEKDIEDITDEKSEER